MPLIGASHTIGAAEQWRTLVSNEREAWKQITTCARWDVQVGATNGEWQTKTRSDRAIAMDWLYADVVTEAINLICSGPGPVEPRIELLAYGGGGLAHWAFRPGQAALKSALVAAGPAVVDPLIASLHDENVNVRQGAAEVLGRIGDPRAAASLAELANDPDSAVRKAAAQAQAALLR